MGARYLAACGLGLAACLLLTPAAPGEYALVEVEKVPVERLVKNLEAAVKKDPKDAQALVNLARAHGMAYALKADTAQVRKGKEGLGPWFGYEPKFVPFSKVEKTDDADKQKAAKAHLAKAVERFKQAVKLAPDNLPARLGYAWALEQSGATKEAVKEYRALIEDAWKKEKDLKSLGLGGHSIVAEASGYLIPLLDKEKDKDEIATLTERAARLSKLPRPITPVAVPLRDGLRARDLEDRHAAVAFDADGSGLRRKWTWVTKDAGWLVYDPKGKGEITSGLQMFGGVTFWLFWETGYDALASLDDNGDGVLTGDELKGLAIWHDANGDGVCDPGEVKPLSEHGIVAVSCRFERDPSHPDRIAFSPKGVTFRDGKTRPTFDLILKPRDGGNDGLNTVVPFKDDDYRKARPRLQIGEKAVLKIDDHVGFPPSLTGFAKLLESRRLAVVQSVGHPNPSRSHFASMATWNAPHHGQGNSEAARVPFGTHPALGQSARLRSLPANVRN